MTCPRCQAANRDDARFCRECGTTFPAVCAACGATVETGSKFCDRCGAPLATTSPHPAAAAPRFGLPESYTPKHLAEKILTSKSALEGERKQVTVLFADLKGSWSGNRAWANRGSSGEPRAGTDEGRVVGERSGDERHALGRPRGPAKSAGGVSRVSGRRRRASSA